MRIGLRTLLGISLIVWGLPAASRCPAQAPLEGPPCPISASFASGTPAGSGLSPVECSSCPNIAGPAVWAGVGSLLWWVKKAPLSVPLVTTGDPTDAVAPGALGRPGTSVLIGGQDVGYGTTNGLRVEAGLRLDDTGLFAIQGSYFVLEQRSRFFSAGGNGSGDPLVGRPIFDTLTNAEINEAVSYNDPTFGPQFTGRVAVATSMRLQGGDANLALNGYRDAGLSVTLLAGFRYLDLTEGLSIQENLTPLAAGGLYFQGAPISAPSSTPTSDSFRTYNKFYGGQVGAQTRWQIGSLSLEGIGKVALGPNQQVTVIQGSSSLVTPGAPTVTVPGGVLALPSNIGHHSHTAFSVVPEAGLTLGYQVTPWLQVQVGYTFLYWLNVQRPGNAVDRTVNTAQIPTDPFFGTPGGGRPVFTAQQSDFWAQGVNVGLRIEF